MRESRTCSLFPDPIEYFLCIIYFNFVSWEDFYALSNDFLSKVIALRKYNFWKSFNWSWLFFCQILFSYQYLSFFLETVAIFFKFLIFLLSNHLSLMEKISRKILLLNHLSISLILLTKLKFYFLLTFKFHSIKKLKVASCREKFPTKLCNKIGF